MSRKFITIFHKFLTNLIVNLHKKDTLGCPLRLIHYSAVLLQTTPKHSYDKQKNTYDCNGKWQKLYQIAFFVFSLFSINNRQYDSKNTSRQGPNKSYGCNSIDSRKNRPRKIHMDQKQKSQNRKVDRKGTYQKNR